MKPEKLDSSKKGLDTYLLCPLFQDHSSSLLIHLQYIYPSVPQKQIVKENAYKQMQEYTKHIPSNNFAFITKQTITYDYIFTL